MISGFPDNGEEKMGIKFKFCYENCCISVSGGKNGLLFKYLAYIGSLEFKPSGMEKNDFGLLLDLLKSQRVYICFKLELMEFIRSSLMDWKKFCIFMLNSIIPNFLFYEMSDFSFINLTEIFL